MAPSLQTHVSLLSQVVGAKKEHQLDALLRLYADQCGYFRVLCVAWSYLHYGAHAAFARRNHMQPLAVLLAAAWQMQVRVLCESDRNRADQERARILAEYRDEWDAALQGDPLTC